MKTRYKILEARSVDCGGAYQAREHLEGMVNRFLAVGWKLQGGLCVAISEDNRYLVVYAQAIIKED